MSGKLGLKNFFTGVSKKDLAPPLEKELAEVDRELAQLKFLSEILIKILGYHEMDRIQVTKMKEYYRSVKKMAQFEIRLAGLVSYMCISIETISV
jgi:hypothetical protein